MKWREEEREVMFAYLLLRTDDKENDLCSFVGASEIHRVRKSGQSQIAFLNVFQTATRTRNFLL